MSGQRLRVRRTPELLAWNTLLNCAKDQGINLDGHRFFGFINPNPSPGSPNYGYEQWVSVSPEEKSAEGIEIKEFPDGLSLQRVAAGSSCSAVRRSAATEA